jgi:hypothetical protein
MPLPTWLPASSGFEVGVVHEVRIRRGTVRPDEFRGMSPEPVLPLLSLALQTVAPSVEAQTL